MFLMNSTEPVKTCDKHVPNPQTLGPHEFWRTLAVIDAAVAKEHTNFTQKIIDFNLLFIPDSS